MQRLRKWIESAETGLTFEQIMAGVERGDFHLFEHPEGVMVSEFIVSPRMKALHVFCAAGSLKAVKALLPVIEEFGRRMGCDTGGATGARWVGFLQRHGYRQAEPAMEKEL